MCGICGVISFREDRVDEHLLDILINRIRHRGPDEQGIYVDKESNLGLASCRLSIIDLVSGHQPISNEDDSIYIVFNGEIYNYQFLKKKLVERGHYFKTNSDTEVILHAYEEFGEDDFVHYLQGMFAFCIYDRKSRKLYLARDRAGKKPLYYSFTQDYFVFASELKSILAYPYAVKMIDEVALEKYLVYGYIPEPYTIVKEVNKLEAGTILIFSIPERKLTKHIYWNLKFNTLDTANIKERDIVEKIMLLLNKAVTRRLISDVEIGALLSGGLDSSTIVALMSQRYQGRVKTFSVSFTESSFDESAYFRKVASIFHTEHYEQVFEIKRLLNILPEVVDFLDEPFADPSILPTYLICKFARQFVKVVLSGDGGDEIFLGYPTFWAHIAAKFLEPLPLMIKKSFEEYAKLLLPVSFENFSTDFKIKQFFRGLVFPRLQWHFIWTGAFTPLELSILLNQNNGKASPMESLLDEPRQAILSQLDDMNKVIYFYFRFYLGQQVLVKVDRASMAASLEVRSPFLDTELIEFMMSLPWHIKLKKMELKHLLKKTMKDILPAEVIYRKKKGFGIPVSKWIYNELRPLTLELLNNSELKKHNLFSARYTSQLLNEHFTKKVNNGKKLWTLLMFQLWYKKYLKT